MSTPTKVFGLTIAALLILTLAPGAPFGGVYAGRSRGAQDRPAAAARPEQQSPESLSALGLQTLGTLSAGLDAQGLGGLNSTEANESGALRIVFRNEGVTIYKVIGQNKE